MTNEEEQLIRKIEVLHQQVPYFYAGPSMLGCDPRLSDVVCKVNDMIVYQQDIELRVNLIMDLLQALIKRA
jgi:hypothetical protein